MKFFFIILFSTSFILISCSSIRDSAGVTRKTLDEFTVIENPPLVIPPDFNLLPPEQLSKKNIEDVESELAKEILFGLDDKSADNKTLISTMDKILLETKANNVDNNIREQINEFFANEKSSKKFQKEWDSEIEILDSIKESERIRTQLIKGGSISEGDVPTIKQKVKKKKRKFFFF